MMYNTASEDLATATPTKKSRIKHAPTPNSKHKDRLIIQESCKRKQSNRKSINMRIAWLQFKGEPIKQNKKKTRKIHTQPGINEQVTKNISKLMNSVQMNNDYIEILTTKITKSLQLLTQSKRLKENSRKYFCSSKDVERQIFNFIRQLEINNHEIQTETDDIHFQGKRITFETISQANSLNLQIQQIQNRIKDKQEQVNLICKHFQKLTENVAKSQESLQQIGIQLQKCTKKHKQIIKNYNTQMSQLFILKFQINSTTFFGMIHSSIGIDKKLLLQKQYVNWERTKQKKIDHNDLKRWILIQLYRGWKNILRKLSYQSSQYQVLFGQLQNEPVLQDLKRFLSQDKIRASSKKWQKSIVFYSQAKNQTNHKEIIKSMLKNFNNNIIQILAVDFSQFEEITQLQIKYKYLQQEQIVQKFIYEQHNVINKQKILKDLKSTQRRSFCLIQIPLIAHKEDILRYNQVYEMIRKSKNIR